MTTTLTVLLYTTVLLLVPIMFAALGEIIAERAGVLNISIEGTMLIGCFAAAGALQLGCSLTVATLVALPVGAAIGALLSWIYITRGVNQIVGGVLFNMLALGVTTSLYVSYFSGTTGVQLFGEVPIPILSRIPIVGPSLFHQPALVYLGILVIPVVHWLLHSSWLGLHMRAAGERPEAVDSAGVGVGGIRAVSLILGSALIALGGAALVVLQSGAFTANMTAGKGFIALAIVMVARWRPWLVVPAAALFAFAESFQYKAQTLGLTAIAPQVWAILPYALTIVAVTFGRTARYPAAIGTSFHRNG